MFKRVEFKAVGIERKNNGKRYKPYFLILPCLKFI